MKDINEGLILKMFGSGISYLTVDLIRIWRSSDEHDFAEKRDRYLAAENFPGNMIGQ